MSINQVFINAARKGAELGNVGQMCPGCAFKPGTEANNDTDFIENAAMAMAAGCGFHCHMEDKECTGFRYARNYMDSIED